VSEPRKDHKWRARAREMRARGKSYGVISLALGVPYQTVRYHVNESHREYLRERSKRIYRERKQQMMAAE
jgi:hypothetical protein